MASIPHVADSSNIKPVNSCERSPHRWHLRGRRMLDGSMSLQMKYDGQASRQTRRIGGNAQFVVDDIKVFIPAEAGAAEDLAAKKLVQVDGLSSAGSRRELPDAVRVSVERDEAVGIHVCWRCIHPSVRAIRALHALEQALHRVLAGVRVLART